MNATQTNWKFAVMSGFLSRGLFDSEGSIFSEALSSILSVFSREEVPDPLHAEVSDHEGIVVDGNGHLIPIEKFSAEEVLEIWLTDIIPNFPAR
jgi:hypothetical protein